MSVTNSVNRMPSSDPRQDSCDVSHLHHSQATSVSSSTVPSPPAFPCSPAPSLTELSLQVLTNISAHIFIFPFLLNCFVLISSMA
jgi:hypothetical protein